jgi:hypothetical protein
VSPAAILRGAVAALWELPQNTLGAATLALHAARGSARQVRWDRGCLLTEVDLGAVSLGRFVFHSEVDSPYVPVGPENVDHEVGHALQSRRLGPLYLLVIGVPSVARVAYAVGYHRVHGRRWSRYYDGFPEKQADALGGVDRSLRPPP